MSKKIKCDYCNGKGYYINEDHPKYPEKQQKLDCYKCNGSGKLNKAEVIKSVCDHKNIISVAGITTCMDCHTTLCDY